ncbi:MAG: TIGR04282 family arsenosugar biosynthesis glycosyltransferase [Ktedonobacteraceae bacterium]
MSDTALVVIARYPEAGKTKTRLARSIGNEPVVLLYKAFLTDLAQRFAGYHACDLRWTYIPVESDFPHLATTLAPGAVQATDCFPQQGADLGARLHYAFQWAQQQGFQYTIVIGSDTPHIGRSQIENARAKLEHADVVLGPAEDGGYYLIAMRSPYDVFSDIPMSTPAVLQMTIAAAIRQGLRVELVETLLDVDELPDLQRLAQMLEQDQTLAPATAHQLTEIRNIL